MLHSVEEIVLKKLELHAAMALPLVQWEAAVDQDLLLKSLVMSVKAEIYGRCVATETFKYPENWREAFKERWFPEWLLRRFPVRYTEINGTLWHKYPNLVIRGNRGIDLTLYNKVDK